MANMRPSWPPPRTPIVDPGGMTRDITSQIYDCRLLVDCRLIVDAWVIADCRLHGTRDRRMVPIWNQSAIAISNPQSAISQSLLAHISSHVVAVLLQLRAQLGPRRRQNRDGEQAGVRGARRADGDRRHRHPLRH